MTALHLALEGVLVVFLVAQNRAARRALATQAAGYQAHVRARDARLADLRDDLADLRAEP